MPRRKVQVEGQLDLLSLNKEIEKAKKENPVPEEKVAKKETSKRTRKTTTNVRKKAAGGRTVGDQAHDGIGYRVPEFGDEQQYGGMFQAQPENVGVEKRKIIGEYFPEHARRHVAQPVPDFFRPCSCHFSV